MADILLAPDPTTGNDAGALIRRLGVSGSYLGMPYLIRAVERVLEEPAAIHAVIKCVYAPIAQECSTTVANVERNIRTLRDRIWDQGDRGLLEEMACHRLACPPTNAELIDIIADYIKRHQ